MGMAEAASTEARRYRSRISLDTAMGTIVLGLYRETPISSGNFECLAEGGFYDGTTFWRIQPGFVIQGGSPDGTPDGGPGYKIKAEFDKGPGRHLRGTIGMARDEAPDSAGSQFFINLADNDRLNGKYTVFGDVLEGMDVVDAIAAVELVPLEPVVVGGKKKDIGGRPQDEKAVRILGTLVTGLPYE